MTTTTIHARDGGWVIVLESSGFWLEANGTRFPTDSPVGIPDRAIFFRVDLHEWYWYDAETAEWSENARGRWDDLRFPAQGINPPGAATDPTVSNTTGLLSFAGNQDNLIAGAAQMPHEWDPGTIVRPHLHLRFPTSASANTRWKFEYDLANVNGDFVENAGTFTTLATVTVANPQNVKKHVVAAFGDLAMTGFRESAIILWKISRLASSDAADNDTNACLLLEFDIHYQKTKHGTVSEFPTA